MNSYDDARIALITECLSSENKVVLLRGKWGTGKTFLWHSVKGEECFNLQGKTAAYASLFGVTSTTQIKMKLAQSVLLGEKKGKAGLLTTILATGKGFVEDSNKLEEAALLWIPTLLANRYIVIDDIERKNPDLDLDEVAGLIDDLSEIHQCKFLLLMNTDQLSDSDAWAVLHEKIVDAEVALDPASQDSLRIAVSSSSDLVFKSFEKAVIQLRMTNIRGIRRAWRNVGRVRKSAEGIGITDVDFWVPSVVILTAMHFKLAEGLPPIDVFLQYDYIGRRVGHQEYGDNSSEAIWDSLIYQLGIRVTGEFERLFYEYVTTGNYRELAIQSAFEKKMSYAYAANVAKMLTDLQQSFLWDKDASVQQLVVDGREVAGHYKRMSLRQLVELCALLEALNDSEFIRELVANWFSAARSDGRLGGEIEALGTDESRIRVHNLILGSIIDYKSSVNITEELISSIQNSGNILFDEDPPGIIEHAEVSDYVKLLNVASPQVLEEVVQKHLSWARVSGIDRVRQASMNKFLEAVSLILEKNADTRLAVILKREVNEHMTKLDKQFRHE